MVIKAGQNIELNCEANGFPEPTIEWERKDVGHERNFGKSLIISELEPTDEGVYECVAKNELGQAFKSIKIKVKGGEFQLDDSMKGSQDRHLIEAFEEAK